MKIKDTTYEQLHEEPSRRNGGLNHTNSNSMYQEDLDTSESFLHFESGTRSTSSSRSLSLGMERVVAQLVDAQASSTDNGYPVFDYRDIRSNPLEVNNVAAQDRDSAACHCQRFGGVATSTTSQDHLISILDDALCIIDETFEELSHQ